MQVAMKHHPGGAESARERAAREPEAGRAGVGGKSCGRKRGEYTIGLVSNYQTADSSVRPPPHHRACGVRRHSCGHAQLPFLVIPAIYAGFDVAFAYSQPAAEHVRCEGHS